jgi:hypothetical protein
MSFVQFSGTECVKELVNEPMLQELINLYNGLFSGFVHYFIVDEVVDNLFTFKLYLQKHLLESNKKE